MFSATDIANFLACPHTATLELASPRYDCAMSSPAIVSLTFDDGFRCQFEKAVPILNNHQLPATFFLIANRDETHDRWAGHIILLTGGR
jgi:peptidoglycan/xylan/chitin deacetylase (PgdA/CDA1 family)